MYNDGQYVLVIGYGIFLTSDLQSVHQLAGDRETAGYRNGLNTQALFGTITGVISFANSDVIWVADYGNSCIRKIGRVSQQTNEFAGKCGETDNVDGAFRYAKIGEPVELVYHEKSKIWFFDNFNPSLRYFRYAELYDAWEIVTHIRVGQGISGMTLHPITNEMYIIRGSEIRRVSKNGDVKVCGYTSGNRDGSTAVSLFNQPQHLVFIDAYTILVANTGSHNIRLVDLRKSTVRSFCNPYSSGISERGVVDQAFKCKMRLPQHLIKINTSNYPYKAVLVAGKDELYRIGITGECLF